MRNGRKRREPMGLDSQDVKKCSGIFISRFPGLYGMGSATLEDGMLEKSPGRWHREERANAHCPCRFAKDGDIVRVATEGCDIFAYPLESRNLIEQAAIPRRCVFSTCQVTQVEEAQYAQTV